MLASAGTGSLYSRVFSARHGDDVHGIVMVDPLHEDLLSRIGSPGRGFLLWIRGVISPCGADRLPGAIIKGRRAVDRVWGRSSHQSGTTIFAKLQESLVAESLTKRDVVSSRAIQDKKTPLVVISSGRQIRKDSDWEDKVGVAPLHPNTECCRPRLTCGIATGSEPSHHEPPRLGHCERRAAPSLGYLEGQRRH